MAEQGRIYIQRYPQGWMADFRDTDKAEYVRGLFGQTVIPTAFTAQAHVRLVKTELRRLNPGCYIEECN